MNNLGDTGQSFVLASWARVVFSTPPEASYFCGYYTESPLSADGRSLLAHRVSFEGRNAQRGDVAELGMFDLDGGAWRTLGTTRAVNWQQGSKLQWLGPDFNSQVIYNDQEGERFVSCIVNTTTGSRRNVPHAIYAVFPSGHRALGVRFERHYFCRAYHYEGVRDDQWNVPVHPEDGILGINLDSGDAELILRTADMANLSLPSVDSSTPHWLDHLLVNPDGTRFAFLHRFGSNTQYTTRVFTADSDGANLFLLPDWDSHSYTHQCWRDAESYVIYASKTKALARIYSGLIEKPSSRHSLLIGAYRFAKRFVPSEFTDRRRSLSGYVIVQDGQGVTGMVSTGMLRLDGHPGWTPDRRFMLTDTYADEHGYRHLLLYDARRDRVHEIGRFASPYNSCGYRCDLHPRFSRDQRMVVIDTAHTGRHQAMVLYLDWEQLQ